MAQVIDINADDISTLRLTSSKASLSFVRSEDRAMLVPWCKKVVDSLTKRVVYNPENMPIFEKHLKDCWPGRWNASGSILKVHVRPHQFISCGTSLFTTILGDEQRTEFMFGGEDSVHGAIVTEVGSHWFRFASALQYRNFVLHNKGIEIDLPRRTWPLFSETYCPDLLTMLNPAQQALARRILRKAESLVRSEISSRLTKLAQKLITLELKQMRSHGDYSREIERYVREYAGFSSTESNCSAI